MSVAAFNDWCTRNSRVSQLSGGPGTLEAMPQPEPEKLAPKAALQTRGVGAPAYHDVDELLAEVGGLDHVRKFLEGQKPLSVLCAMVEESRPNLLSYLSDLGVKLLADRQKVASALTKAVREGRVTRGWADATVPDHCAQCRTPPIPKSKLLVCGRCKSVKYCSARCQRAAWPAHKAVCRPLQYTTGRPLWESGN